jgi:prepilin-type processing-associated H-X9-DG protein
LEAIEARASLVGWGMIDPGAGRPAWASGSELLAYVCASEDTMRSAYPRLGAGVPFGRLVVEGVKRTYVKPSKLTGNPEVEQVVENARNIALALQMYMVDHGDVFPLAEDVQELMQALTEYVRSRSVFMRPGTEDEVVVEYLAQPGIRYAEIAEPAEVEVATIDYHRDFSVVAYADGHVRLFEKD